VQRSDGHAFAAGVYARADANARADGDYNRHLGPITDEFRDADRHCDSIPHSDRHRNGYADANRYRYANTNGDPISDASSQGSVDWPIGSANSSRWRPVL
jgi:hypothetical protein